MRTARLLVVMCSALGLLACAAPTTQRFTLRTADAPPASTASAVNAISKVNAGAARVMTVDVRAPDSLDRSNWIVRGEGPAVTTFQQVRWPQSLPIEVADALAQRLDRALQPEITVVSAPVAGPGPRVEVRVVSFDMWLTPTPRVFDEFLWEIQCPGAAGAPRSVVTGRTRYQGNAGQGAAPPFGALAAEHAKAVDQLAEDVLTQWRKSSANSGC
jgi:uncharacterized lipoprotein YmbA